jgi:hypothetical protein
MSETVNIVNTILGLPTNKSIYKKYLVDNLNLNFENDKNNKG